MTSEEYIASGILELYAAGALAPDERQEVERQAAGSAEVRAALQEACDAMESYAQLYAVQPNPALKGRIMEQISGEAEAARVVPMYPEADYGGSPYKWMFAASVVLFLMSGFLSFHFYQKWQQAQGQLSQMLASQETLAQNYHTASLRLSQQEQLLGILQNENFRPLRLKGVDAHPGASIMVYWNPQQQQVYVNAVQLPPPPAGSQYQLWALDNGKPIDAGMLAQGNASLQQMKQIASAQAFAVTLEPEGGSANPTLEQLYVMGEVKS